MNNWRILLVEDERLVSRVVVDALRTIGFPCEVAESGREVLRFFEHAFPNLVILDVRLPDMSGVAILHQIRQHTTYIPVILTTAYALDREMDQALAHLPDAVLYKPYDIETLLATVRHLLMRQPAMGYALVSMPASEPEHVIRSVQVSSAPLLWLRWQGGKLVATVHGADDSFLCLRTPPLGETPPDTVWIEWYGEDALYEFRTRVVSHTQEAEADRWLIRLPATIRRIQRRRHSRIPAQGRVGLSLISRVQRVIWGKLHDISLGGIGTFFNEVVGRNSIGELTVEWELPTRVVSFQTTGVVCSVVAGMEEHQPLYRVGIRFDSPESIPFALRKALRTQQKARWIGESS